MQRLIVTKDSCKSGFTLLELLVVTIMVGIMAAIAAPSMLNFINRGKVSAAHSALNGALQEIQREAIKRGESCAVTFPASDSSGNLTVSSSCLITGSVTLEQVRIRHNLPSNTITLFNFKGETDTALTSDAVIVVTQQDSNSFQKCIAISDGLGLIRIGSYQSAATDASVSKCTPKS